MQVTTRSRMRFGDAPLPPRDWIDSELPLCVDLDGTLVQTDMLTEGIVAAGFRPEACRAILAARPWTRSRFKQAVGRATQFDPATLPYNHALLAFLREQKNLGRHLVLVTAANEDVARCVADHLDIFDEVIASSRDDNLKGARKAAVLVARFGRGGFCYAGDSRADLHVWAVASRGILVDAAARTTAAAQRVTVIENEFRSRMPRWLALLKAMRPYQWTKNLLAFVPLFASGIAPDRSAVLAALLAFAAFCCSASGIYLLNDLSDLAADRRHPRKRRRPLASGDLPLLTGLLAAVLLVLSGAVLASAAGILGIVGIYALLSLAYSVKLKELPLIDVFVLAALYSIRLVGGGEATGCRVSLWLLAFSSFLFLSLALVKRGGELAAAPPSEGSQISRRGYYATDAATLHMFGSSTAVAASVTLAMFIQHETTQRHYASPELLWGIVPLVLFWQCRIWLSTSRGYMHDDPIVYAAKDWVSWMVFVAATGIVVVARSVGTTG